MTETLRGYLESAEREENRAAILRRVGFPNLADEAASYATACREIADSIHERLTETAPC